MIQWGKRRNIDSAEDRTQNRALKKPHRMAEMVEVKSGVAAKCLLEI